VKRARLFHISRAAVVVVDAEAGFFAGLKRDQLRRFVCFVAGQLLRIDRAPVPPDFPELIQQLEARITDERAWRRRVIPQRIVDQVVATHRSVIRYVPNQ